MAQELLTDFETLTKTATPLDALYKKAPRSSAPPKGLLLTYVAAMGVLLLAVAAPAMGTATFPLLFAIFAICFVAYFGGAMKSPIFRESDARRSSDRVDAGDHSLTCAGAAWQILPLPICLATFGLFTIAAKAIIFA